MHNNITPKNHFIYITGCDGTGKSTQVKLLLTQLNNQGAKTHHVWLRFPFFFSIPFLAYARLCGFSWYEDSNGYNHGYWDFRHSLLMRQVFPWFLLLDAALFAVWEIYLPLMRGVTVVCERFVLDMLVDLSVAFGENPIYRRLPWRLYLKLLPTNPLLIILDLDEKTIHTRREDLCSDHLLANRIDAFRFLARSLEINTISSMLPIMEVNQLIVHS